MLSPIQYLMTGLFLLGFTPEYKRKIASLCCCCCKKCKSTEIVEINLRVKEEVPNSLDKVLKDMRQMERHEIVSEDDEIEPGKNSLAPAKGTDVEGIHDEVEPANNICTPAKDMDVVIRAEIHHYNEDDMTSNAITHNSEQQICDQ